MDEQLELRLRTRLLDEITPVTGGHPSWATSPAARRIGTSARTDLARSDRLLAPTPWWTRRWSTGRIVTAITIVALLLTALALVGIAGSRQLERTVPAPSAVAPATPATDTTAEHGSQALSASGFDALLPDSGYVRAVADVDGVSVWLLGDGRVTRYSSATGTADTWTVGDDIGFVATSMAAARGGGVWLVGSTSDDRTLRWFDGERFRDVVEAPGAVSNIAETPDGSLWTAGVDNEGTVREWNGTRWIDHGGWLDRGGRTTGGNVTAIAVDAAGSVWIGGTLEVQRFDGRTWQVFDRADAVPLGYLASSITPLPDGAVLVATMAGLARYDGTGWSVVGTEVRPNLLATSSGVGPDGAYWVAWEGATSRIARLDGSSWTTFGTAQGLPEGDAMTVVPTRDGVFAATDAGLFRLTGTAWDRVLPAPGERSPTEPMRLLPVSYDEGWAIDTAGLWHFLGGTWTLDRELAANTAGEPAGELARAGDGTVWAATDGGVLRRDGGQWTVVDPAPATTLAAERSGAFYVSGDAVREAYREITFTTDRWTWDELPAAPFRPRVMAVDRDGTLWAATYDPMETLQGLARFDGTAWETVTVPTLSSTLNCGIVATQTGRVFVLFGDADHALGRWDGSTWTFHEPSVSTTMCPLGWVAPGLHQLAADPDGTVWVANSTGLYRFDNEGWSEDGAGLPFDTVSIAPDGTGWAIGPAGLLRFATP